MEPVKKNYLCRNKYWEVFAPSYPPQGYAYSRHGVIFVKTVLFSAPLR